ncbi:SUMF1/EgtB/PvdO family nonheme iron enzyme [uncultured Alistipes sp.]|uniref:SUMF1/EgtB/PvdO family nonheme iron enzyme n=1 Tax=uncultured Alistipes sp. TaxID=538949 RepID=UPI0025828667|nr:SUMF1/EgtB/PvdO family nonheme iron enzyme [uncultured Alistipes sp.]
MKRIFQYGFALALAACSFAACSDDDTGENGVKTDVTLSPSTSLTGVSFSANTLNVSNNGIYPSASIAVKKADGSALSGVTLQVELSNNSASEEWCQIEPKNNALQFTVQPYEGGEAARSIDVRLTGSGNGVSINPFTFKIVQAPTPKSAEAHILDFSIPEQTQPAEIDYEKMTITVNVPFGTDVTALTPEIEISAGASVSPASGEAQDFSQPVKYTVTAEDGITRQEYQAAVVVEEEKSHEAEILEFTVPGQIGKAEIGENTVKAVMKAGTNLSSLAPVIKVSEGAKISPASGSTQDFSQPVKYTVTAEDSKTTREYTVTLTVGGEVVLDTSAEPAAGVTLSGNNYTVVAGGAAAATTVKVSLTYSGSPIADLTGYTFAVEATDAKSGAAAAWVKVSQVDASGAFTFTVDPNADENARRATIAVSCTDNSGAKLFGSGSVGISQDGTEVGAQLIELIDVPGGRFLQGDSPDPTSVIGNARYCNLTSFSIGKYEVTQAQFEEVMGFNPSEFKKDGATHPVESVSIWDAMQFCDELSKREGYTTFYNLSDIQYGQDGSGRILTATRNCDMSATGYRLPTLAEWEYAAKGGAEGIAQYSYLYAGGDNPLEMGWWRENEGEKTHPVGEKPANPIGIHDMCGNVGEWNHDWYERPYMSDFPSTDEVTDPFGPDEPCDADDLAFIRGGDYDTSSEWNLRITYWSLQAGGIDMNPNNMCRQSGIGFRVVIRR